MLRSPFFLAGGGGGGGRREGGILVGVRDLTVFWTHIRQP